MEWKWHLLDRSNGEFDEHLAILRALLKALQAVAKANAGDILALEEIAQQSLEEFYADRDEKKKEKQDADEEATESSSTSTTEATSVKTTTSVVEKTFTTASTTKADTDLQAFLARLEQKTAKPEAAAVTTEAASTAGTTGAVASASVAVHDDEEEKAPVPVGFLDPASVVSSENSTEPPYPKSFTEVMEMIKKGEPVPGIQQIEERISDDAAKLLSEENAHSAAAAAGTTAVAAVAPAKPWEKR
jgi:hypothetical protein